MDDIINEEGLENKLDNTAPEQKQQNGTNMIAGAILLAGVIIAGAILLKGTSGSTASLNNTNGGIPINTLAPVTSLDRTKGNPKAKVTLIMYEDYQCPFCAAISGLVTDTDAIKYLKQRVDPNWAPFMPLIDEHQKSGNVLFVYRDYPFLGPESIKAAEAARCAGDQNKFWEYHDYLYTHQNKENQGVFSDPNLKIFAKKLGLDTATFDKCFDGNKYAQAVTDSKTEGMKAGVTATPKGFILRDGKIVDTIEGAISYGTVKQEIENALK